MAKKPVDADNSPAVYLQLSYKLPTCSRLINYPQKCNLYVKVHGTMIQNHVFLTECGHKRVKYMKKVHDDLC